MKQEEVNGATKITVSRRMKASAEQVFDAWLDPETIGRWFAPDLGPFERIEVDARVGGRFSIAQSRRDGIVDHIGEYLEIDRPRRLVFTFGIADMENSSSRVEVDLKALDEGCELTLTTELPKEWATYADRTEEGWTTLTAKIDEVLA